MNKTLLNKLDRILAEEPGNDLLDCEFTIEDYCKMHGKPTPRRTAHDRIRRLIDGGEVSVRPIILNGHLVNAYRFV